MRRLGDVYAEPIHPYLSEDVNRPPRRSCFPSLGLASPICLRPLRSPRDRQEAEATATVRGCGPSSKFFDLRWVAQAAGAGVIGRLV